MLSIQALTFAESTTLPAAADARACAMSAASRATRLGLDSRLSAGAKGVSPVRKFVVLMTKA